MSFSGDGSPPQKDEDYDSLEEGRCVDDPLTSPAYESPVPSASEPPSSNRPDDSSPIQPTPESSPAQSSVSSSSPPQKRKRYELSKPDVPFNPIYWPPAAAVSIDDIETDSTSAISELISNPSDDHVLVQSVDNIPSRIDDDLAVLVEFDRAQQAQENVLSPDSGDEETSDESECESGSSADSSHSISDNFTGSTSDSEENESSISSDSEQSDVDLNLGDVMVYEGCALSVDEGVYLLMDLFMTQKLSKTTLESFLKILLKFIPENHSMPRSKHALIKYVEDVCPPVPAIAHYYCKVCHFYVGKVDGKCSLCSNSCNRFYHLPIANQVKSLFENLNLAEIIDRYAEDRKSVQADGKYSDLCDGSEFKKVQFPGKYNLTLLGHTDGISISESSNVSLWPQEFVIAQVPPKLRYKFVLIGGIWVDSSKPNFHCFFKPTAEEFEELASSGVTWVNPKTQKKECSLVLTPCFCGDAPVRADLQNILSVGGKHCCNTCEKKMVKLPPEPAAYGVQKKKRKRVFYPQETPSTLRTSERMKTQGENRHDRFSEIGKLVLEKGVKGGSIISKFPSCDRSTAVYPEYMHSILGIVKQFMEMWFETSDLKCSMRKHRDEMNTILEKVKRPDCVTRCPKTTNKFSEWKANDCRSFLLYLSVIVLAKFMSTKYLQHWMLFVSAVYLLLQDVVSDNDILKADIMLRMFLRDFPNLYPATSLTYNLHNLSHYGLSARRLGPFWSSSAFYFEDFNGSLSKRIHGTKNQGVELVKTIQLFQGIQVLRARYETKASSNQQKLFRSKIKTFRCNDVQRNLMVVSNAEPRAAFYRAVIMGEIFTCKIYKRQREKNNFTVCFKDLLKVKRYGEISCFVECSDNRKLVFINCFAVEHVRMFCHESGVILKHIIPIKKTDEVLLVPLQNILFKVIRVDSYVCIRPNRYEVNL